MQAVLKTSGVVGAGGAGFPTYAKLTQKAEYIILNAAECEPLLRVDQQLLELFPTEIITGLNAARECVEAKYAFIGVKAKHAKVIDKLKETIGNLNLNHAVEIKPMADVYPAGDEQVMVYELTGRVVPESNIPLAVGCVVINAETALNLYKAVKDGTPVTETYITLAGDIENRITLKVPVGTPVTDVLKLSGLDDFSGYSVIDGGPMMGAVLQDLNGYVSKKSKGFIILKNSSRLIGKKNTTFEQAKKINRASCEQCRMCTDLCPRYLLGHNLQPHKIIRIATYNIDDTEGQKTAHLCCLCGLCELSSCPVGLFPKMANESLKNKMWKENVRYTPSKTEFEARPIRKYRMMPSKRLIYRLGLYSFDKEAPMVNTIVSPKLVRIFTSQHVGVPATPVVTVGESVYAGQLIGDIAEDALGAAIHASIDGVVTKVCSDYIEIAGEGA